MMHLSLWDHYLFNVFLNSCLMFLTLFVLIEAILCGLRVRSGRLALCLRLAPVLKLPLDLFLYDFSNWALAQHLNPLEEPVGTRTFMLQFGLSFLPSLPKSTGIQLHLQSGATFTLADLLALMLHPLHVKIAIVTIFCLAVLSMLAKGMRIIYHTFQVRKQLLHACSYARPVYNLALAHRLVTQRVQIVVSSLCTSPFAFKTLRKKWIVFPSLLAAQLSQTEYEAVLAHEIEHLRWWDAYFTLAIDIICAFFWWIPTRWWRKRMAYWQEAACDRNISRYHIEYLDLASALTKTGRYTLLVPSVLKTLYHPNYLTQRFHALLHPIPKPFFMWKIVQISLVSLLGYCLFAGRFWIF